MGTHFAEAVRKGGDQTAIERRFTAMLNAHPDDLPDYLRQAVSFLKSKEVAINWAQLLRDLQAWGHPDKYVQKRWADEFWSHPAMPESPNSENQS